MKIKKDRHLLNMTTIIILVISITLGIYLSVGALDRQKKIYSIDFENKIMFIDGRPYLPVEIDGKRYNFLFDTGSTISSIVDHLADKLGIGYKCEGKKSVVLIPTFSKVDELSTEKIHFKIADNIFYQSMGIYKKSEEETSVQISETPNSTIKINAKSGNNFDGIIGMDIISKFYWIFDIEHNIIYFSKKNMKDKINKNDSLLEITYQKFAEIPYMNLILNDTLKTQVLFDTGLGLLIYAPQKNAPHKEEVIAAADICINGKIHEKSLMNYLKDQIPSYSFLKNVKNINISPELKINGYALKAFVAVHADNNYSISKEMSALSSRISGTFLCRFSKMHFDPFNQKITFIKQKKSRNSEPYN